MPVEQPTDVLEAVHRGLAVAGDEVPPDVPAHLEQHEVLVHQLRDRLDPATAAVLTHAVLRTPS